MKKLCFIVPVYNVQDYVIRCLTSLVNQNIPATEYDIIVVNDGSPDKSLELIENFAESYTNIRFFSQENKGVSEARNQGLKLSNSKYVWFIDSDDWITENCLKELLQIAEESDLDMFGVAPNTAAQSDFKKVFKGLSSVSTISSGKERLLTGQYVIGSWCYIYSSRFLSLNNLSFKKSVLFEDEEFTPRALFFAKKVAFIKDFSVYFYFVRENSICHTISKKSLFDRLNVANSLDNFVKNNPMDDNLREIFYYRMSLLVLSGFNWLLSGGGGYKFFKVYLTTAKLLQVFPLKSKSVIFKTKILFWFWNTFPSLMYCVKKTQS